eukprot:CAMPEP_0197261100 /NCGR_PEP_ID=MMETSP1429-20130617/84372_1 /TAXON_ID=49237 /ORGANISM="Chaetoceros  sp., Strain UNC1202" /LENGTH=516 /DNA_ID=CAMNT_0042725357 /DNA_START=467 /DNA_END=2017 /DNA_ORIENTATION=+
MNVTVAKHLEEEEVRRRDEEEQKVIEATIKARVRSMSLSDSNVGSRGEEAPSGNHSDVVPSATSDTTATTQQSPSFGSNLDHHLLSRSRTVSVDLQNDTIIAMSPEERRRLEEEMRSQNHHPLLREMNRNAEEESQRHVLEHHTMRRERRRSSRGQVDDPTRPSSRGIRMNRDRDYALHMFTGVGGGDYDANSEDGVDGRVYEEGPDGERPSLDDLFMMEAAMYLSMRDDSTRSQRRRRRNRRATRLFRRNHSDRNASNDGNDNGDNSNGQDATTNDNGNGDNLFEGLDRRSESILRTLVRQRERDTRHPFIEFAPSRRRTLDDTLYGFTHDDDDEEEEDNGFAGNPEDYLHQISEASQIERAIQLSLQEAQTRERVEAAAQGRQEGAQNQEEQGRQEGAQNQEEQGRQEGAQNQEEQGRQEGAQNQEDDHLQDQEQQGSTGDNSSLSVPQNNSNMAQFEVINSDDQGEEEVVFDYGESQDASSTAQPISSENVPAAQSDNAEETVSVAGTTGLLV